MLKLKQYSAFLLLIAGLFIHLPNAQAQAPHTAYGVAQYTDASKPVSLTFRAFITTRPGETLNQNSPGCHYSSTTGEWTVQCASFATSWSAGDVLQVDFDDGAYGAGTETITLSNNAYDNGGTTTIVIPTYEITITTNPQGREVTVDSQTWTSPLTFTWEHGSEHTLGIVSPQYSGTGKRYIFTAWDNGGEQNQIYTVPGGDETVTASFQVQYELAILSDHGNPQGTGWYDSNTTAAFSVTTPDVQGTTRYVFRNWSGSYSGSDASGTLIMTGPKTITAVWDTDHYLTVVSDRGTTTGEDWYREGTSAAFSISPDLISVDASTRYLFTTWSGNGIGAYDGTSTSYTVTMNNPITQTAQWATQYFLSTSENPETAGDMIPAPPGGWYDSGTSLSLSATSTTGYQFAYWSGNMSGTDNPAPLIIDAPKTVTAHFGREVQITIDSNPTGRTFTADNITYTAPCTFIWVEGQTHEISSNETQSDGTGVQFNFISWTHGRTRSHTYTVPATDESFTANFLTRYLLTVNSSHGDPQGEGWYDANTEAAFSVSSVDEEGASRYLFSGWTGDYTGTGEAGSVFMNSPKTVNGNWSTQHYLELISSHGMVTGDGWYDEGGTAGFSVSETEVTGEAGSRYVFTGWTGDGADAYTGSSSTYSVVMNSPVTETAEWKTQFFITTRVSLETAGSIHPAPPGQWSDSGSNVLLSAAAASGYGFARWTGDLSGNTNPDSLVMNGPKTVEAVFGREVEITIATNPSGLIFTADGATYTAPETFDWIELDAHTLGLTSPQSGTAGVRYVFASWSNGGNAGHIYTVPGDNTTETAAFTTQYTLTIYSDYGAVTGEGWYDANSRAVFSVASPITQNLTRYAFDHWSGDFSGSTHIDSLLMDAPKTIWAEWITQHYLTVVSDYGSPYGEDWYTSGAQAIFGVNSPHMIDLGTRYFFTAWTGSGSGASSTTAPADTIIINNPVTETASWKKQYLLTTVANPEWGGDITPPPPGEWYDENTSVIVAAAANEDLNYAFTGWSGAVTGMTNPATVSMNTSKSLTANFVLTGTYVITTEPVGLPVTVDDTMWISPKEFTGWTSGSNHTLSAPSLVDDSEGTQHLFQYWSDNGSQTHIITIDDIATYTAFFKTQYLLTVNVNPPNTGYTLPAPPGQWFEKDSVVTVSASPVAGYQFGQWTGNLYSYENPDSIAMNGPKQITANFVYETTVADNQSQTPDIFLLKQNHPNPFNHETVVEYQVPMDCRITIILYNMRGETVRTLVDRQIEAGFYRLKWDGKNRAHHPVQSGVYLLRMHSGTFTDTKKLILVE